MKAIRWLYMIDAEGRGMAAPPAFAQSQRLDNKSRATWDRYTRFCEDLGLK